jgi:hypothetical protein
MLDQAQSPFALQGFEGGFDRRELDAGKQNAPQVLRPDRTPAAGIV